MSVLQHISLRYWEQSERWVYASSLQLNNLTIFACQATYIFPLSLQSTVSVACTSLNRSRSSRSGKSLSGVLDSWTLESALHCSAKFPRDTIRGLHSANTSLHTFWLLSRPWKLFLRAWWSDSRAGFDISGADFQHKLSKIWKPRVLNNWILVLKLFRFFFAQHDPLNGFCNPSKCGSIRC